MRRAPTDEGGVSTAEPPRGTLGTVRNATLLLELLSRGQGFQQLTDLAERSGLSLPTVHRLLRSLVVAGLVEQDPSSSRYGLGPELVRLSERYLARLPVLGVLAPYLVELRDATKATVLTAILVRESVVYVDRVDGEDIGGVFRISHRVHHALETAAGRVLLSHADEDVWTAAVASKPAGLDATRRDRDRWRRAPSLTVAAAELHDQFEVAVPVLGRDDRVLASLSATGNPATFTEEVLEQRVVPQLLRAAAAVHRTMSRG